MLLTYGEGALNIVTFQVKSNKMPFNQLPFGWYQKGPTSVNPTRNFRTVPEGQKESGNNPQHFRSYLLFGFQRGRRKSYSNSIARTRKVLYAIFLTSLHYFVFTLQICVETSKRRGWKQRLRPWSQRGITENEGQQREDCMDCNGKVFNLLPIKKTNTSFMLIAELTHPFQKVI